MCLQNDKVTFCTTFKLSRVLVHHTVLEKIKLKNIFSIGPTCPSVGAGWTLMWGTLDLSTEVKKKFDKVKENPNYCKFNQSQHYLELPQSDHLRNMNSSLVAYTQVYFQPVTIKLIVQYT